MGGREGGREAGKGGMHEIMRGEEERKRENGKNSLTVVVR